MNNEETMIIKGESENAFKKRIMSFLQKSDICSALFVMRRRYAMMVKREDILTRSRALHIAEKDLIVEELLDAVRIDPSEGDWGSAIREARSLFDSHDDYLDAEARIGELSARLEKRDSRIDELETLLTDSKSQIASLELSVDDGYAEEKGGNES